LQSRVRKLIEEISHTYRTELGRHDIAEIESIVARQGLDRASALCRSDEIDREIQNSIALRWIAAFGGHAFLKKRLIRRQRLDPLFYYTPTPRSSSAGYQYEPRERTVFYLLNNCRPFNNGGYAVRAHGIISALKDHGYDVVPIARPGYPKDVNPRLEAVEKSARVDGVVYNFLDQTPGRFTTRRDAYARAFVDQVSPLVEEQKPAVIHAASFHFNGHAALKLREKFGVPVIYEVRGLSILLDIGKATSRRNRPPMLPSWRRLWEFHEEVEVAKAADHLLCITEAVASLYRELGVPDQKISLLPNAAPMEIALGPLRMSEARGSLLGYFGSIQHYEGLEDLCEAVEILSAEHPELNVRCLIIGDGPHAQAIRKRVRESKAPDRFELRDRVPHDQIQSFFQQCAAMVYPRRALPVCELISPLKPFEPMSYGIPVISSDVAALREIVHDRRTGFIFTAGNSRDLANVIAEVLSSTAMRNEAVQGAKEYVQRERNWSAVTAPITQIYHSLYQRYMQNSEYSR
jgi:glycosyltransferase involved in cell wall biosynthesis